MTPVKGLWCCKVCVKRYRDHYKKEISKGIPAQQVTHEMAKDPIYIYQWDKGKPCLNCNATQQEVENIWICPRCLEYNLKDDARRISYQSMSTEVFGPHNKIKQFTEQCTKCKTKRKLSMWVKGALPADYIADCLAAYDGYLDDPKTVELNLKYRALISALYLLGSRVSEIVSTRVKTDDGQKHDIHRLRIGDFKRVTMNGEDFLVAENVVLLKKRPKYGEVPRRATLPILMRLEPTGIMEPLLDYLELYKDKPQRVMFPFSSTRAKQIVKEILGNDTFPHMLRHARATHLRSKYGFDILQIKDFFSHSSLDMSAKYVHEDSTALMRKMAGENK